MNNDGKRMNTKYVLIGTVVALRKKMKQGQGPGGQKEWGDVTRLEPNRQSKENTILTENPSKYGDRRDFVVDVDIAHLKLEIPHLPVKIN